MKVELPVETGLEFVHDLGELIGLGVGKAEDSWDASAGLSDIAKVYGAFRARIEQLFKTCTRCENVTTKTHSRRSTPNTRVKSRWLRIARNNAKKVSPKVSRGPENGQRDHAVFGVIPLVL